MGILKLANNASSTLAGGITDSDTSLSVATGDGAKFPSLGSGDWHPLTIVDASGNYEIVKATARSGDVFTVTRAQESTAGIAFASGSRVDLRMTAGAFSSMIPIGTTLLAANNLDDVDDAPTARTNLGIDLNSIVPTSRNIGVGGIATGGGDLSADRTITVPKAAASDVLAGTDDTMAVTSKALQGAGLVLSTDFNALAMQVAENSPDRINLPNGMIDPFKDTSDVNVGAAVNLDTSVVGSLRPTIPAGTLHTGTTPNTTTPYNGTFTIVDATFLATNGNVIHKIGIYLATAVSSAKVVILKENSFTNYDVALVSDAFSHPGGGWFDYTLPVDFTVPSTGTYRIGIDAALATNSFASSGTRSTIVGNVTQGQTGLVFAHATDGTIGVRYNELGTPDNLTVTSNAFTAGAAPDTTRLSVIVSAISSITINTDLIGSVSRDGGTTFTQAVLAAFMTLSDGSILYVEDGIDISGQPSGTSMEWKFVSANNKNFSINTVGLRWG